MQKFPDEQSAREWLERNRWGDKPHCPGCRGSGGITARKGKRAGYYHCGYCKKEFHVRIGTMMESSHIPLRKWLYAVYLMDANGAGISSVQLAKALGITQKSAWLMLRRLREADADENGLLAGIMEIDYTRNGGQRE